MTFRSRRLLPLVPILAACNFGSEPSQKGELGNDRFFYECVSNADALCDEEGVASERLDAIPRIALGAAFGIGTEEDNTEARAGSDHLTEVSSDGDVRSFRANLEGWTAILSRSEKSGEALDILHVFVAPVATVELSERAGYGDDWKLTDGSVTVVVERELRLAPFDAEDNALGGGLPFEWSAAPEGLVEIVPDRSDNDVKLRALGAGAVTLTAKISADQAFTFSLQVDDLGLGGEGGQR